MPIDASIYGQIQQPKPVNVLAQYADMMQLQGAQQNQQLNRLKIDQAQRALDDTNALNSLYAGAVGPDGKINRNALITAAAGANLGSHIPQLQKSFADADAASVKVDADKFTLAKNRYDLTQKTFGALSNDPNLSKDLVLAAAGEMVRQGVVPQEFVAKLPEALPDDPQMLRQELRRRLSTQLSPEQILSAFAPKPEKIDNGATLSFRDTNPNSPTYGQNTAGASVQKQASPGDLLSAQTSRENAAATRDVAAATREAALIGQRLKNDELLDKAADRALAKDASVAGTAAQIAVIDKALTHPGRTTATGLSGTVDPRNYVPGTDATDFRTVLDQIGGAAFLKAFESLKGGGQITEIEGKKATDAIARLSRAQSDTEFEQSLRELRDVMVKGYERQSGKTFDRPAPSTGKPASAQPGPVQVRTDADYNALPSGAVFVGPDGKQRRKP